MECNTSDREKWEHVFQTVKVNWRAMEPDETMHDCLNFFKEHPVKTVFDLGCAVGIWSMFLAKNGYSVAASDFSETAIEYAKSWATEEGMDIQYEVAPVSKKLPGTTYDAVVASKIIDNLSREEAAQTLKVLHGSMGSGSVMYALFSPFMTPEQIESYSKGDNPTKDITHTVYTDEELKSLFSDFRILRWKTYENGFRAIFVSKSGDFG